MRFSRRPTRQPAPPDVPAAVLDGEPLWRLVRARRNTDRAEIVRALMRSARRRGDDVVVPSAVLAEVYRGGNDDSAVDHVLASARIGIVTTGRAIARIAGGLLARDGLDSCHVVDALVVATARRLGGGVILTSDPYDLRQLAASFTNVRVVGLSE